MTKTAWLLSALLAFPAVVSAGLSSTTPAATPSMDSKADLERLRLENENLKLKLRLMELKEKATPQAAGAASTAPTATQTPEPKAKKSEQDILREEMEKTAPLAAAHKEDAQRVIVDFYNNEIWYKGVRYSGKYIQEMAKDQGWKCSDRIVAMDGWGRARHLYRFKNLSFLIYDGRDKGIIQIDAPKNSGDLDFLTTQGLSFASTEADIRNADFSYFFKYNGMDDGDKRRVLKFSHGRFLAFGDDIEFTLDQQGKLVKMRFGVLGEH